MTMNIARAFLVASAFFGTMTLDVASGFNAASAGECTPGTVERDGHQVETKCDPATGVLIRQIWLKGDKRDRADGPAFVMNDLKAATITEVWWKNDAVDRADGPAITRRDTASGVVMEEEWHKDGLTHRADGGPAIIARQITDSHIIREEWWINGKQHRDGAPAVIWRTLGNGTITGLAWYKDGQSYYPSVEVRDAWLKKNGERMAPPSPHFP